MDVNSISQCKPKGNYAVSYANAQTFKGGAVSLDNPVDTFTKQNNNHTTLKVVTGVIVGLAAIIGAVALWRGRGLKLGKKVNCVKANTKYSNCFKANTEETIKKMTQIEGRSQEIVAKGETVEQRVNNFLNNENYVIANPPKNVPKITTTCKLEPHKYNTSLQDTFVNTKPFEVNGSSVEYYGVYLKDAKQVRNPNSGAILLGDGFNVNNYHIAVGRTPNGRAFVQYTVGPVRIDMASRPVPEHVLILSKTGEFTPVQRDLIKILGSNTDKLNFRFPMLECSRDIKGIDKFVASEDVLFSGIHTMAKNSTEGLTNRYLPKLQEIKNGEFMFDLPLAEKTFTEANL